MGKVIALLKTPWIIALLGVLLLALLIWFGGPYLGLGAWQPLASPITRLVLIILIVVTWGLVLQIQQLRARRKAAQMAGDIAGQADAPGDERDQRQAAERAQLRERFQEAVGTLRKTRRGGGNLYAVPWYVVIGPPGSGKTTLLQNSGLNFPLASRFGNEALRGVGGTRNCDWWFTDEAIFLDTAGRYTTQDSDQAADASAWQEFLKLLRKYRRRRPINGVIVAMSVSDLLTLDEVGMQQHIDAVRRRLDELTKHLGVSAPIYLVFTKCDLVAGFTEFFDDLNPDQRSQVWGASFPIEQSMDGSAPSRFNDEFNLLIERLGSRILDRLHAERDRRRRAAVFSFPQQFNALKGIARKFVSGVFTTHQYAAPLLLRGFYLTSGTQEGTPIDRMMGAVARTFGLEAQRVHAPGAQSRTFFVERLLKDVLFKESGLAGTNPQLERRKTAIQVATYAGVLLFVALMIALLATSYSRNSGYLAEVQQALDNYPAQSDLDSVPNRQTYFARVLERDEALSSAVAVADQYRGDVPLLMRFGLYQGRAVGDSVRDAYFRELNGILLPSVASLFRNELTANAGDPQALYYYLKGYLMLGEPDRVEAGELVALADIQWQKLYPGDPVLQQALSRHFNALVTHPEHMRALTLNTELVVQARNTLRTAELSRLVYSSLQLSAQASPQPPLLLDQELGLLGNVFQRKSGVPLSEPIAALYTQPVFAKQVEGGITRAVDEFAADDWVFGGAEKIDTLEQSRIARDVLGLYQRDYIKTWDQLLDDLRIQPIGSIQEASAVAAKLSGPNSPLKLLLKVVRDNTHDLLRVPPEAAQKSAAADAAKALAVQQAKNKSRLAQSLSRIGGAGAGGEPAAEKPDKAISDHFAQLNKLTEGAPGAMPIDRTLAVLEQLSQTLLTMTDFSGAGSGPNPQLLTARQQAQQLPPPVSDWVAALTGKSQELVATSTQGALNEEFAQQVQNNCAAFTRGRYPFDAASNSEIPLQNFGELFGYGGAFDSFYKQTLANQIDASGRYWRWKPNAVGGSAAMLRQMQAADQIKQMFFRGGNTPQVDFRIVAPKLGPGLGKLVINIDGQIFTYEPGAPTSMAMKWPGPSPGQVSISGYDPNGTLIAKFDYHGDWAFFRALQAAKLEKQSDLRFLAHFDFGGQAAQVVIQADNLKNPFLSGELARFECGS